MNYHSIKIPEAKSFLGYSWKRGHISHNLHVRVTVAVATCLSVVMRVRAKLLREATH
ncbi:putative transposable element encoded protein [Trachipleistophora hominis]|uniref:Putative transposable element encoded protein n=1 Tax=Trachipleistophora hominis TaxID=72359 RepID=L7JUH9_TRAHO|nr:putative transposable element encoded protein [Trachipleistophora hominis]